MKSQLKSVFIFVFFLAVWVLIALAVEWQPDMGFKGFNSSLLLKEEIILADGTKLVKSADNKTMEIRKDGLLVFNLSVSSSINGQISIDKDEYSRMIKTGIFYNTSAKGEFELNFTIINNKGFTLKEGLHKDAYHLIGTTYDYIPIITCDLYNTSGVIFDQIFIKPEILIENTMLKLVAKINIEDNRIKKFRCNDPLVSGSIPIVGYVTADGNSGTEYQDFKNLITNNNITNFTWFSIGAQWSNLTIENYDSLVDIYALGNFMNDNYRVSRLNGTTRGIIVFSSAILDNIGFCKASADFAGTAVTLINNTGPIWNTTTGWINGSNTVYNSFKDMRACDGTVTSITQYNGRQAAASQYIFANYENNTRLNGSVPPYNITTKSRWVHWGLDDSRVASDNKLYVNQTLVHSMRWVIDLHRTTTLDVTAPTFTVYNESTTNSSSIVSSLASEAANSTWFIYNTTGLVYNVTNTSFGTLQSFFVGSLQNFTNYLVNLTRCDSSGNCATNRTFNFTTRQNAAPAAVPDTVSYINLSFPANNSVFTDPSWLNFSANGSGFHKLYNMTLYINNTRNASADKSLGGGVDYYIGNFSANISAGFYIWRVEIQNATGGFNISESRYFTVNFTDSVAPTFTVYNESTTNISTILSSLASEAANSTFRVYNDTVLVYNVTNTSFGTLQSFFVGSLSNGTTYWVNLTRCDSSGNCATNKTFNFTTRFNPPGPDITAPTFTVYNESTTNISTILSSLASEAANSTWWIYNATALVYNVSNASYGTFHSFFLGSLQNFTIYWVNLTRCDAAANCATNKTFNFTTAQNTNDSVAVSAASAPPGGSFIQEIQEVQSKGLAEYILYILGKYPFTSFGVFVFFVILSERKYKRKTLVLKKEVFHVPKKDYNIN